MVPSGAGDAWLIGENTGTVGSVNFLGTFNNDPPSYRVNNEVAGRIDPMKTGCRCGNSVASS